MAFQVLPALKTQLFGQFYGSRYILEVKKLNLKMFKPKARTRQGLDLFYYISDLDRFKENNN